MATPDPDDGFDWTSAEADLNRVVDLVWSVLALTDQLGLTPESHQHLLGG